MARFRPTLVPTLVALPMLAVLLGLGAWQLHRLAWKEALIAERESRLAAPPVPLPAFADAGAQALAHRRFTLRGSFLADKSLSYGSRAVDGRLGVELLTPFRLEDGRIVLVNRGWVPDAARAMPPPAGTVEVVGVLRPARAEGNWFTPEPDLRRGHWFLYDTRGMAAHLGLDLLPGVVEALPGPDPGVLPLARAPKVEIRNEHLQYAITWFALALALATIYVLYHLKRERRQGSGPR